MLLIAKLRVISVINCTDKAAIGLG